MATKIFMEALSPTMEEGRLVKWNMPEGAAVKSGDVLAEVETDKAVMELVARGDGVLRKQLVAEGTTAPVGSLVGVIAAADEDIAALVSGAAAPAPVSTPAAAPSAPASTGPTRSSPLARRLARESGVDVGAIAGSGPGGRVIKRDIEAAMSGGASTVHRQPSTVPGADYTDQPLTQIRKTIAKRLAESIGPIPTFYLTAEFDMTRAVEMRAQAAGLGDEFKVSVNDIVLKAVATALAAHPEVNAHWLGDKIRYFNRVHLGMAVATAIINPPESGILAIGTLEDTPVVVDGAIAVRKRMRVTMSCDHRVIDGAVGARFLLDLRRMLENPLMLVF